MLESLITVFSATRCDRLTRGAQLVATSLFLVLASPVYAQYHSTQPVPIRQIRTPDYQFDRDVSGYARQYGSHTPSPSDGIPRFQYRHNPDEPYDPNAKAEIVAVRPSYERIIVKSNCTRYSCNPIVETRQTGTYYVAVFKGQQLRGHSFSPLSIGDTIYVSNH